MYDIIDLVSLEFIEGGFDTYADAQRYLEENNYSMEQYGIEGPADEAEEPDEEDDVSAFNDPSQLY